MRAALEEARQYKDPKTEYMVSKEVDGEDKTIVIDKKDWPTYQAKGWKLAEEIEVNTDDNIIDMLEKYVELKEFTSSQMAVLKKEYGPLKGKRFSTDQWKKMETMLGRFDNARLKQLADSDIPMLATAAKSELVIKRKAYKWSDFKRPLDMDYKPEELDEGLQLGIVKGMTQRNDHFGARLYIAQQMNNKELVSIYHGLGLAHDNYGSYVGNSVIQTRDKLEKVLYSKINGKWGTKAGNIIIKEL